jgi:hypothetical protein
MGREYRRKVDVESLISIPVEPVLIDGFEEPLKWSLGGAGTDFDGYRDSQEVFEGDCSFYMITKVTTPTAGDYVQIIRYPPIIRGRYISVEVMFKPSGAAGGNFYFYLNNCLVDPTDLKPYYYRVRLNNVDGQIEMETASGTWTNKGSIAKIASGYWQKFGMVIDTYKKKVVSAETGKQYVKIDTEAYSGAAVTTTYYELTIKLETRAANRAAVNLDNVVVKAIEI